MRKQKQNKMNAKITKQNTKKELNVRKQKQK